MDFGNKLTAARKSKGLSQEELAEMLGVSRQTIYKWETGITYPDIDKLCDIAKKLQIPASSLLDDEISTGDIPEPKEIASPEIVTINPKEAPKDEVIAHFRSFARGIGLSTLLILIGVAVLVATSAFAIELMTAIGVVILLGAIAVAVLGYVVHGIRHESFKKETDGLLIIEKDEAQAESKSFTARIAIGLALIFIGVIGVVICGLLENDILATVAVSVMLALIGVSCHLFITGGIMHDLYSEPVKAMQTEDEAKRHKSVEEAVSGIIMAVATAVFLVLGFVFGLWHPGWVTFPIGAIISGCVSSLIKLLGKGKYSEEDDD